MNDLPIKGRRAFIKQAMVASASLVASTSYASANASALSNSLGIPFYGKHQAGIATPAQKHIYFIVLDLHTEDLAKIKKLFQLWTDYSVKLTAGQKVRSYSDNRYIPPNDTGEAESLAAHQLTLTFGISPDFFEKLNISHLKPNEFNTLPHFPRDQLQERYIKGDICIQACADDPQVAFHAVRNLVRAGRGEITPRWSQMGFNSFEGNDTPRNLFAFKDGTANQTSEKELNNAVWYQGDNWLNGGSYLAVRRIKTFLETWDRTNLASQEETFGRHRHSGAPMGGKAEFEAVDLDKKDAKGNLQIPEDSHVHLAKKTGMTILRRSFSYASGVDEHGQLDAGLLFISFQNSPERFIKLQNSFGNTDRLNEYITHIGSGLFACFAGVKEGEYLGQALFEQALSKSK
ncbi:deferrochelatase/peroxidase EfeB [Nicoletella semolina]|uniref:Deferrochelatase n=1 Tax=Nicoletella semolina TaxID=271160 RepID=A0A4V2SK06_9PAST|nr:iron uptake transporter deferrochelatase/peroxidase subunit [Nicoletella semolina]MDH2923807.1 peroxidase [Nicoletella semolina]TCP17646.1 deferrochelatase/peroxidase EfeB [Nicoletella semolina]